MNMDLKYYRKLYGHQGNITFAYLLHITSDSKTLACRFQFFFVAIDFVIGPRQLLMFIFLFVRYAYNVYYIFLHFCISACLCYRYLSIFIHRIHVVVSVLTKSIMIHDNRQVLHGW